MDSKYIEQLLQRYWQCDTSPEEETQLRHFFLHEEVPPHLQCYKSLFEYQEEQRHVQVSADFDDRLMARLKADKPVVVKARRVPTFLRLIPLLRAAAAIVVLLGLGHLMQRQFYSDDTMDVVAHDTIGSRQTATPSVALSQEGTGTCEKQLFDSLQQNTPTPADLLKAE